MEKVINMDEVLTKAFNEIEQEIQEKQYMILEMHLKMQGIVEATL